MEREWDLIVIGGGAAGLTAARNGVARSARTLLIQDGPIGGDCTFTGCVPSKTLLAAAARGTPFDEAMATVHATVAQIAATEDDRALARSGITVLHGRAALPAPGVVEVDGTRLQSRHIVLATGTRPAIPPVAGIADSSPLTSDNIWSLPELPERLGVLGGGPIGCELAQAFARLGSTVTLVEAEDRLLPEEEPETSAAIAEALAADGVDVRTTRQLEQVVPGSDVRDSPSDGRAGNAVGGTLRLQLTGGPGSHPADEMEVDRLLVAVGRHPVTEGLGLDRAGVELDSRGYIHTDATLATSARNIWAAGDITGRLPFTHAAAAMARVAVGNALDRKRQRRPQRFDTRAIPWVTFTGPEVGRVGVTEADATDLGGRVAFLPLDEVDRAVTSGETRGFVKLIAGPRRFIGRTGGGRVLGATVVAPTGGELIHEPALAMQTGMFTGRLAQATHAYPTWAIAIQQAAAQFFTTQDGRSARPARRP